MVDLVNPTRSENIRANTDYGFNNISSLFHKILLKNLRHFNNNYNNNNNNDNYYYYYLARLGRSPKACKGG